MLREFSPRLASCSLSTEASQVNQMTDTGKLAGSFPMGSLSVQRMGFGAMQLAGPMVWGPPKDPDEAARVLRNVIEAGVNHIDTSDFYGPHVTNQLIRETLAPYPDELVIVTKVGARRAPDKSWPHALGKDELISAVHDNLRNLGLQALDVVNLRIGTGTSGPNDDSIAEPFGVLADLQRQGLIRELGMSNCTPAQLKEAQAIAPVVCVQNSYNVAHREDDAFVESCAAQGIAFVPFFPLGGFRPLQAAELNQVAAELGATPMQVALAWLLHRSPNVLLIPGTKSVGHLRENLAAADLKLPAEALATLDALATAN